MFGGEIDVVDAGDPSAPHFRMDFGRDSSKEENDEW